MFHRFTIYQNAQQPTQGTREVLLNVNSIAMVDTYVAPSLVAGHEKQLAVIVMASGIQLGTPHRYEEVAEKIEFFAIGRENPLDPAKVKN